MFTKIFTTLATDFQQKFKQSLNAHCFLETATGENILVAKDGSLASVIKIDGIKKMVGPPELEKIVDSMGKHLGRHFKNQGHALQVWFARDPDLSEQLTADLCMPAKRAADRLSLDLDDVFEERRQHLSKFLKYEAMYFVVWTRWSVLTKRERSNAMKDLRPPQWIPSFADAQDPFRVSRALIERHRAFARSVVSDLKQENIRAHLMQNKPAIAAIRSSVYPEFSNSTWQPSLPGDPISVRQPEDHGEDASHFLWSRIEDQIFAKEAEIINPRMARIGGYYYSCLDMSVGPQHVEPFSKLLDRIIDLDEIPWRVSYLIEGGGLQYSGTKRFLTSLFQLTNKDNNLPIRTALEDLKDEELDGQTIGRLRISFSTWAPVGENAIRKVEERVSRLQQAVESWGQCLTTSLVGDPLEGVMSSALGLDVASTAPPGAAPLPDAMKMLPWDRDASPFEQGSVLFRTEDGRPWPFQPGSSKQSSYFDIIFAQPRRGKSVLLNTCSLSMILSSATMTTSGLAELPRISIVDIGVTSEGVISLIKGALPPHLKHQAVFHRLSNTPKYAINPFGTQLGMRKPLPLEKTFLSNFLTILCTDPNQKTAPAGVTGLLLNVIDVAYAQTSDKENSGVPKVYNFNPGAWPEIEDGIKRHNIAVQDAITPWWQLVDEFFKRGEIHLATMAQSFAVPVLDDLTKFLSDPTIVTTFGTAKTENGEPLIAACTRAISTAIREFPIFSRPTRFDLGDARIIAIDLDEVAPNGEEGPAVRQTSLMYMLARYVLGRDFFLTKHTTREFDPIYQPYHEERIRKLNETPKRLVYDEWHRVSKVPSANTQLLQDVREGAKKNVHIAVASQLISDFSNELVNLASGYWILGAATDTEADELAKKFGLSETGSWTLRNKLRGPGPKGAPFLMVLDMKEGKHEHLLYNTLGPAEMWAFSTTADDVAIRQKLYDKVGAREARRLLAKNFPEGSAKKAVEQLLHEASATSELAKGGILDQIAEQIIQNG